jgi:xylose isomerase
MVTFGNKEFFPGIGKIQFEGNKSTNPLAFRYYDKNRKIGGKSMKDHFRFAVAYWHSFCAGMKDQFGSETRIMQWNNSKDPIQRAKDKMDAFSHTLIIANDILEKSPYLKMRKDRYASFDGGLGRDFEERKLSLEDLRNLALKNGEPAITSGKQELYEAIINMYI